MIYVLICIAFAVAMYLDGLRIDELERQVEGLSNIITHLDDRLDRLENGNE